MATVAAVTLVAAVAAFVSYRHMRGVAIEHGEDSMTAAVLPLSVDGLIVAASMSMWADRRAGRRRSQLSYALLTMGACASLTANVLHADPNLTARAIAAWPPLALLGSYELLMRQIRPVGPLPDARRPTTHTTDVPVAPGERLSGTVSIPAPRTGQPTLGRSPLFLAPVPVQTPDHVEAVENVDQPDPAGPLNPADPVDGRRAAGYEAVAEDVDDLPDTAAEPSGQAFPGLDTAGKRDAIIRALEQSDGSAAQAAALLAARGISVSKSWVYQVRKDTRFAGIDTGPLPIPSRPPARPARGLGRGLTPTWTRTP